MRWWSWFWRDKDGRVILVQRPNWSLIGWFLAKVAEFISGGGTIKTLLSAVSTLFLLTWSIMEITRGVTPFRKTLGAVVLVIVIISLLNLL